MPAAVELNVSHCELAAVGAAPPPIQVRLASIATPAPSPYDSEDGVTFRIVTTGSCGAMLKLLVPVVPEGP
jgi:hypothetical protein